jgi:hypothetical protein
VDDFTGRRAGAQCGQAVWALVQQYFDGSVADARISLALRNLGSGQCEVRCHTLRGFYYTLQSTTNLARPFTDEPGGPTLAYDSSLVATNTFIGGSKYFRAVKSLAQ